ncbi:MAG TPA: hypothetical protein PKY59_21330 [Pyrinomonadaceae bacterium]|nr:hypothetical protein [Pyrinomonadaceae bacterium]
MKVLKNLLFVSVLVFGFSMSASAQKNDQDKDRPPKNPPGLNPGDKGGRPPQRPPENNDGNRPKKPQTAWLKTSEEKYILFV